MNIGLNTESTVSIVNNRKSIRIATVLTAISIVYIILNPTNGYDLLLQIFAIIGLWPVFSIGYLVLKSKEISFGIFFLTLYQTWNMFLRPYLGEEQFTATYRTVNNLYLPEMGLFSMMSLFMLYYGFIYGYYNIAHTSFWKVSKMKYSNISHSLGWVLIVGISCSTLQGILSIFGLSISFLSSIDLMIPTVVGSLLTMYLLRKGRNFILIALTFTYLAYNLIYVIGGTLFIYVILIFMGPLIVYISECRKIPYLAIILGVILLMPIYTNRHEHRREGLYSTGILKLELGKQIIKESYSDFSVETLLSSNHTDSGNDNSAYENERYEGVTYLGQIVHCHKDLNYSYQYGKTFMWLPTMFVPHMFLPMRPGQNMGTEWAEYYHIKDPSWRCSINFPMLVEFYCNFGWFGMIFMSWINGFAIVWVMGKFNFGNGDLNLLLLLFIALKLIVVEANITLNYGLILQVLFICWLIKRHQLKNSL